MSDAIKQFKQAFKSIFWIVLAAPAAIGIALLAYGLVAGILLVLLVVVLAEKGCPR